MLGTVAGGHNDVLVGLGLLGATCCSCSTTARSLAGLAAGAATLVKLTGGIGILALAAWALVAPGPARPPAGFAAAAAGLVGARVPPARHVRALGVRAQPRIAVAGLGVGAARACSPASTTATRRSGSGCRTSDTQLLVTVGRARDRRCSRSWLAVRMRRVDHPAVRLVAAIGAYLVVAPYVLPWYPAWVIPALALVIDRPVARLLAAQASLLVVVYELKTQALPAPAANAGLVDRGARVGRRSPSGSSSRCAGRCGAATAVTPALVLTRPAG